MLHFFRYSLIPLFILLIGDVAVAQAEPFRAAPYYTVRQTRIVPSNQPNTLTIKQLSDLVYFNQERNDLLKSELNRAHKDIQDLERQVKELNSTLTQFKNYYFRQM
jgi:septal ring factor EnvC (AmiA/AmiB activator)